MTDQILAVKDRVFKIYKNNGKRADAAKLIKETAGLGDTQSKYWANILFNEFHEVDEAKNPSSPEQNSNEKVIDSENFSSIEEMVKKCNIDTSVWAIRDYAVSRYDTNIDGVLVPRQRIRAVFERKDNKGELSGLLQEFIRNAKEHAPEKFEYQSREHDSSNLLEISIFDSHIGKLASAIATGGANYDTKIAGQLYRDALSALLNKTATYSSFDEILFPVGNDFFNSDNQENTTTAGTPQDEDGRWFKTFTVGCKLITDAIEKLASLAPTRVVLVAGNHDRTRTYYLGCYLEAWFRNNKNVKIDNAPTLRKYHKYGVNLIGFTHGKEEKFAELPLIMATEKPKDWADSLYRFWHVGHFHKDKSDEYNGVKVSVLPSLCAPDEWHSKKGFVGSTRSAVAFLYDRKTGLEATFFHNVQE